MLRFRFQHRVERLRRIGQRRGVDRDLALDQPAHRGQIALRVDAERIVDDAIFGFKHQRALVRQRPAYLLRGGERTKAHRHTGSIVYTVAKGKGYSIIEGKRYDWNKSDIFVVPSWAWHEHGNASERDDAVLFSFSDLPSIQALGLYREETFADNDGHQKLAH